MAGRVGFAAPALQIDSAIKLQGLPAHSYLEVWEDLSKTADINTVLNLDANFRDFSHDEFQGVGYSKSIYWVRFRVYNASALPQKIYLEATDPQQYLDFYVLDQDGRSVLDSQHIGSYRPISQQRLEYRFPVLEIPAQPGMNTYLFRMEVLSITFPYSFWTHDALVAKGWKDQTVLAFIFGTFAVMALYNIILGLASKRSEYFYYSGYLVTFILLQLFLTGTGVLFFGDSWTIFNRNMFLLIVLMTFFIIKFSMSFLQIGRRRTWPKLVLNIYMFFCLVLALISIWDQHLAMRSLPLLVSGVLFIVFIALKRVFDGDRPTFFYAAGWLSFFWGVIFLLGYYSGYFGSSELPNWSMLFATALQFVFFSLAIGERLRSDTEMAMKEQDRLVNRLRVEMNSREHAFQQLGKVFYAHQLQKMEQGHDLESTMPTGPGYAAVIQLDIVNSSQIRHARRNEFFIDFLKCCHEAMMENYDSGSLRADAYRIKEMGDGFLCSVGYPFQVPSSRTLGDHAVLLANRFIEIFRSCVAKLQYEEPIYCAIGIAAGEIEGFFPNTGTKEYDLYGRSIILANRYESMRKSLFANIDSDLVIIQEAVFQELSSELRRDFIKFDLSEVKFRVRDDPNARVLYYRRYTQNSKVSVA